MAVEWILTGPAAGADSCCARLTKISLGGNRLASILDVIFAQPVSVRVYGLGAVALGVTGLFWGDFAVAWQPDSIAPGGSAMGYAVPIAPLLAGLAMQWKRAVSQSAIALVILYAVAEIFLDVPRGVAHASAFIYWYGVFENLALAAGGVIIYAHCARLEPATAERLCKITRIVFGVCLIYFGLAHHLYLANTASMVPAWLPPGQVFWAYATGAAHIAAGIALLSGIYARAASDRKSVV